jgi:AcrR family transcriptional regulator
MTLHQALMKLILEKGYDAVTIADVCETADVGRSTFYSHFPGKDALLRSGVDHLRDMLADRRRDALAPPEHGGQPSLAFSLAMFEHAREHRDLHRALAGGGAIAVEAVREIVSDVVREELAAAAHGKSVGAIPRELVVQFVVGAFMAVVAWWLDRGAELPAEEIERMFRRLATEGITPPGATAQA